MRQAGSRARSGHGAGSRVAHRGAGGARFGRGRWQASDDTLPLRISAAVGHVKASGTSVLGTQPPPVTTMSEFAPEPPLPPSRG